MDYITRQKPIKIAIEGMDGVGKTTIAKRIANEYQMLYIEKPLEEIFNTPDLNGKANLSAVSNNIYSLNDEVVKAWFFGMGNIYSFLSHKKESLVVDRHFASNYFWNGSERSNSIFKNMIDIIGKPDITILLYASVETRLKRLYQRNKNDFDLSDTEKHVLGYDKMIDFLEKFEITYVLVNTENKNQDEVYLEVCKIVDSLENNKVKKLIR